MTAVTYQVIDLMCSIRLQHGSPPHRHNLAGDDHHSLFFHVRSPNQQPTIMGVDLRHKNFGRPWFTETRVIRYQPFVLVHNDRFHSQCHTNDKGSNQTCENNIMPPTDIQHLNIHVRNSIRPQTSQRYTNRMKWTATSCSTDSTTPLYRQDNPAMDS
jgi:hypothetical protein